MKKVIRILSCIYITIKKNFFIYSKNDISHNCEDVPVIGNLVEDVIEENEEYLENYTTTTRWQTL